MHKKVVSNHLIALAVGCAIAQVAHGEDSTKKGSILEEIIVTAQKREERLQDVPISISVLSGDDLDSTKALGVIESLSRVPGVAIFENSQGLSTMITVRGAATGAPSGAGASTTAYYLDTIPFGDARNADVPDTNAYDLDRVEVLRGPQGTLYGATALNGVVRVLTNDADLNDFQFKARTSMSTTDSGAGNYRGDMALNVPIVEGKLAARAVVGYQSLGGWIEKPNDIDGDVNNVNDAIVRNYRLKVNAKPTDKLSVGLLAWRSSNNYAETNNSDTSDVFTSTGNQSGSAERDAYGLKVGYEFSRVSVSSATSYMDNDNFNTLDIGAGEGAPAFMLLTDRGSEIFSEELLLSSKLNGRWRWAAGAFYRDAKDRWIVYLPDLFGSPAALDWSDTSESTAVFGEVGRLFFQDRLEFTVGLRRFHDKVDTIANESVLPNLTPRQPFTFNSTTPRVVLTWKQSPDLTYYASYSQGFRSGLGQIPVLDFPPVKPDKLTNYEVGAKGNLWNGRLAFDSALYYIDWKDTQQVLGAPSGTNPDGTTRYTSALVNSESASGVGVELGLVAELLERLQLSANFSWNDLTFDEDVFDSGFLLFNSGDRLSLSAEYTAGVGADYTVPLGDSAFTGKFSASANYTSEVHRNILILSNQLEIPGNDQFIARASFGIESEDQWTATLFVENLTNEDASILETGPGTPRVDTDLRLRPRTIGVQLEYRF